MEATGKFAVIAGYEVSVPTFTNVKMSNLIYFLNLREYRIGDCVFVYPEKWWKRRKKRNRGWYIGRVGSILVSSFSRSVHFNLFNSVICDLSNPPLFTSDVSTDINKLRIFLSISRSRITSETSADVNFPWIRFASRHVFHWIRLDLYGLKR